MPSFQEENPGWEYSPRRTQPCQHCSGRGHVSTTPSLRSPGGKTWDLIGSNPLGIARAIAEANAPERLTPEARAEVWGTRDRIEREEHDDIQRTRDDGRMEREDHRLEEQR